MRRALLLAGVLACSLAALADSNAEYRRGYDAGYARCQRDPYGLSPDFTKMTVPEARGWHAGCDAARVEYNRRASADPENGLRQNASAQQQQQRGTNRAGNQGFVTPRQLPTVTVKSCHDPGATEFDCALETAFRQQTGIRVVNGDPTVQAGKRK